MYPTNYRHFSRKASPPAPNRDGFQWGRRLRQGSYVGVSFVADMGLFVSTNYDARYRFRVVFSCEGPRENWGPCLGRRTSLLPLEFVKIWVCSLRGSWRRKWGVHWMKIVCLHDFSVGFVNRQTKSDTKLVDSMNHSILSGDTNKYR